MPRNLAVVVVVFVTTLSLVLYCLPAKAGIYTTTYTSADGLVVICTTVTDNYGTPISVNCYGG